MRMLKCDYGLNVLKMASPSLAEFLMRIKLTELEMMRDRGFSKDHQGRDINEMIEIISGEDVSKFLDIYLNDAESSIMEENMSGVYKNGSKRILVKYLPRSSDGKSEKSSITVQQTSKVETEMISHKPQIFHAIIIAQSKISSTAKTNLTSKRVTYNIEIFSYDDLMINKTKHVLVPEHRLATPEEISEYNVHISEMPRIFNTDPICRYYGFSLGQVIKITRKKISYPTLAEEEIVFRVVSMESAEDIIISKSMEDDDVLISDNTHTSVYQEVDLST